MLDVLSRRKDSTGVFGAVLITDDEELPDSMRDRPVHIDESSATRAEFALFSMRDRRESRPLHFRRFAGRFASEIEPSSSAK